MLLCCRSRSSRPTAVLWSGRNRPRSSNGQWLAIARRRHSQSAATKRNSVWLPVLSSGAKPNLVADDQAVPEDALVLVATSGDLHIVTDRLRPRPQPSHLAGHPLHPPHAGRRQLASGSHYAAGPGPHRTATSGARSDTAAGRGLKDARQGPAPLASHRQPPPDRAGARRAPLSCPFCSRRHRRAVREELRRAHGSVCSKQMPRRHAIPPGVSPSRSGWAARSRP